MPPSFRVGLVQMAMTSDPAANVERAVAGVRDAAKAGAQVVCLPELYRSPYFCQREDAANSGAAPERSHGRSVRRNMRTSRAMVLTALTANLRLGRGDLEGDDGTLQPSELSTAFWCIGVSLIGHATVMRSSIEWRAGV